MYEDPACYLPSSIPAFFQWEPSANPTTATLLISPRARPQASQASMEPVSFLFFSPYDVSRHCPSVYLVSDTLYHNGTGLILQLFLKADSVSVTKARNMRGLCT